MDSLLFIALVTCATVIIVAGIVAFVWIFIISKVAKMWLDFTNKED